MEGKCPHCGEEALFTSETLYEGFAKVGERWTCTSCGKQMERSEIGGVSREAAPSIFGEEDRPETHELEGREESRRICRYCRHYLVNAFTQRCGVHLRQVQATDTCGEFESGEDAAD